MTRCFLLVCVTIVGLASAKVCVEKKTATKCTSMLQSTSFKLQKWTASTEALVPQSELSHSDLLIHLAAQKAQLHEGNEHNDAREASHAKIGAWSVWESEHQYVGLAAAFVFLLTVPLAFVHVLDPESNSDPWRRARMEGWICNCLPIFTCAFFMIAHWSVFRTMFWPLEQYVLRALFTMALWDFGRNAVTLQVQRALYCGYFGMTPGDRQLVMNRRDIWESGVEVEYLLKRYGSLPVRIMDSSNRRLGHVLQFFMHLFFFKVSPNARFTLQLFILWTLFNCLTRVAFENDNWYGCFVFSGARMRDGKFGRFNLVVAAFWSGCGKVMIVSLFMVYVSKDYALMHVPLILAIQPVIFGDTFGELIGGFFGRLEFHVRGFGEVNKKTVEGALAVFVTSFVSMMVVRTWCDSEHQLHFKIPCPVALALVACVATGAECVSLRGTDNFFMMVGSGVALLMLLDASSQK